MSTRTSFAAWKKSTATLLALALCGAAAAQARPNILVIYADDLGYGDVSANGATKIATPNIDRIAARGMRFTNAHATSATCTPSRYAILTGQYPWRRSGTRIAPGDASLIIPTTSNTLPKMLQGAGYRTAAVGKWHLGLGTSDDGPNWNGDIRPSPNDVGFDYSFILPATGDRVPCVYVENHHVVGADPADPIAVNYKTKVGNEPTGADHPELQKIPYSPNRGHDGTIVNGMARIGSMSGGQKARWVDEDMADRLTAKAAQFISEKGKKPFFLYFAPHDIHVPHMPNNRFVGKSGLGLRGDAILELDWSVGRLLHTLDSLGLTRNTLIIFSSDNGPAVQDGYEDEGWARLNGHTPGGPYRGGKYSAFDAGTRVPLFISWPAGGVRNDSSAALVNQIDLFASLARLTGQPLAATDAPDSHDEWAAFCGKQPAARAYVVEQAANDNLGILTADGWKYIRPHEGPKTNKNNIEMGNDRSPQLYYLVTDPGERANLAEQQPEKVRALEALLQSEVDNKNPRN